MNPHPFKVFLRLHVIAIFFSVVVGVISVLPSVLAPLALGHEYQGISFYYLDDEDIYRARIHEILDGYPEVASPYVYEYKDAQTVMPPINEYLYALLAKVFGLSSAITLTKFLFPTLLFFLVYLLTRRLVDVEGETRSAAIWTAITAGLMSTLGFDLVNYQMLGDLFRQDDATIHLLVWTRTVNPIVGGLLLFTFLLLLWRVTQREGWISIMAAALILAVSVGYFFAFGLGLSAIAILSVFLLFLKEYTPFRRLLWVVFLSFVLEIPYWYKTLSSVGGESGREMAERNGMFFTHGPVMNKLLLVASIFVLVSFIYAIRKRIIGRIDRRVLFITTLLLSGFLSFNQQVITGRAVWPAHFVQYTIPFSFITVLAVSYIVWRPKFPRIWSVGIVFLCLASFSWGVFSVASFQNKIVEFRSSQSQAALVDWLNADMKKDCVVLLQTYDESLERLIPAYTRCNVYSTTYTFFGVTKERVLHNFFLRLRLNGVNQEYLHEYLLTHEDEVRGYFFSNWNQMFGKGKDGWFLDRVAFLEREYGLFLQGNLKDELLLYRMDYLVAKEMLSGDIKQVLPGLTLVERIPGYYIYSFSVQ